MKKVRIGINGFGRIGRAAARIALHRDDVELAAINSRSGNDSHAYLLQYDSIHGTFDKKVTSNADGLIVADWHIAAFHESDPTNIPWNKADVDIVIEATGVFTKREQAAVHLHDSVQRVIISAPSGDADITVVMGVNHTAIEPDKHTVISNASCTTNCLSPIAKVLDDSFGIIHGTMTTCHSPTQNQKVQDASSKDPRRGRSAYLNIIPTTTGAAQAVGKVLPNLDGKLAACALRVPNPNGSIVDLTVVVKKSATIESVIAAFQKEAEGNMKGILGVSHEPLVSQDIIGTSYSSLVDAPFVSVVDGTLIKVLSWYDNEWGYATRLIDLSAYLSKQLS